MLRVPVLVQRCGGCQVVVNWYGMLCHTQYIHNLAWGEQWTIQTTLWWYLTKNPCTKYMDRVVAEQSHLSACITMYAVYYHCNRVFITGCGYILWSIFWNYPWMQSSLLVSFFTKTHKTERGTNFWKKNVLWNVYSSTNYSSMMIM